MINIFHNFYSTYIIPHITFLYSIFIFFILKVNVKIKKIRLKLKLVVRQKNLSVNKFKRKDYAVMVNLRKANH